MTDSELKTSLELDIQIYNQAYRDGNPIITDEEYDKMLKTLEEKFPDSQILKKGVVKQKVSRKQKLPIQMYSLNKLKSVEEIKQWLKSANCINEVLVLTPKFDGISLVVEEEQERAWTRGDGEFGQQSNNHFQEISYRENPKINTHYHSFGEAIMSKKNFEKHKDKYANPRNMVAGLFNRDEPGEELGDVDYIRYGCDSETDKISQIRDLNLINRVQCECLVLHAGEFLRVEYEIVENMLTRIYNNWGKNYQIDGLVIEINNAGIREELGREENLNPKYARAIKLPKWSQEAIVKVEKVSWQVSKQGKLKPVIEIEPTELSGVTISNVTGYNAKYIFDNNIARGSFINIVRSGDVIPKHIETVSYVNSQVELLADTIVECPSCKNPTKWDETFTEIVCVNPECKEMKIMKLVHFFSTLEIEDFGEPSIRRFYEAGYDTVEKILSIKANQLLDIEGFAMTSTWKLINQFEKLRVEGVPFAKLLHAYDYCDGKIGEKTIQLIFDNIPHLDSFQPPVDELIKINGVSYITAEAFTKGMYLWSKYDLPLNLVKISYFESPKQEVVGNKYEGMKICFTGCRPSKEQEQMIQSQGGEIVSGVSNKTTHLIVKDSSSTSSKMQRAKEFNIKILTIKELF